ncbi:Bud site selection protein 6 [Recurvomyces mirabilis]|uniref:Bud site selection protein 6 n=1 Tax=Recurvomyces mirabilis TaxID=574656 RepID=A0AAE0TQF6_9PEZI|nr:Bud site selection protein 6 [Recurvomyces mirabilis]KAK5156495.1 Bud site selection protein 6 [Recurvomyces mirabilis]
MSAEDPQRTSAGSARSSSGRSRQNPQQQLSTIEKSVTHLLVATKQLLETLTMWSRGSAHESEVSDVYVRLGYEFNIACRAFNAIGVDTGDLGPVPDLLRSILEDTLSQEASQASLDRFLPRIRDIIINLLHGLKKKQQRLRQKNAAGGSTSGDVRPPRQASTASNMSVESSLTQQLEDIPNRQSSSRSFAQRQGSGDMGRPDLPPRTTSTTGGRSSPRRAQLSPQNSMHEAINRDIMASSNSDSSLSSNTMQNIPVIAPYPETDTIPTNSGYEPGEASPDPPRPPPKQNDALTALQRGGDLERRASRRFSAYQIQKHLGGTMNGTGIIPPAQHSPLPNRGRDVRESMSAVRSRASVHNRARSRHEKAYEPSPNRSNDVRRISEEPSELPALPTPSAPSLPPPSTNNDPLDSPMVKTPEDKLGEYPFPRGRESHKLEATLNGAMDEPFVDHQSFTPIETKAEREPEKAGPRAARYDTPPHSQFIPDGSPQAGKELTLFLQYKSKIKRYVLDGGELSIPRLQLAFIEKFAWNTHNNGVDLPEIYIQDSVSGVRYELDGVNDIKDRSVLVLNVEQLDEVKRHIDDGIGGLRRIVEGIKAGMEDQQSALKLVSDRQQDTAKELAGIAALPQTPTTTTIPSRTASGASHTRSISVKDKSTQLEEVRTLRRDLAVVRQTYNSFVSDMNASMTTIRSKATNVKKAAAAATVPDLDSNTGRAYVNKGKTQLSADSEKIVNRVDDLQDLVEDLRKDVVTRGVRPLPRQLESVSKDVSHATSELKKLQEFLRKEKPVWTKIWEKELQVVCDERELLTMQEELAADLEDDLEKAAVTFGLVEQATKQQNLHKPDGVNPVGLQGDGSRSSSRNLKPLNLDFGAGGRDPKMAHDGVLGEVRALEPNHEDRLEAIERAEKARQRELESRKEGEFQRELGSFVEEGKLKKSGGVEEVERLRKSREEATRREVHRNLVERERVKAEKAAEKAAVGAAESAGVGALSVPGRDERERESSDGEGFVDAKEDVGTPSGRESGP